MYALLGFSRIKYIKGDSVGIDWNFYQHSHWTSKMATIILAYPYNFGISYMILKLKLWLYDWQFRLTNNDNNKKIWKFRKLELKPLSSLCIYWNINFLQFKGQCVNTIQDHKTGTQCCTFVYKWLLNKQDKKFKSVLLILLNLQSKFIQIYS